jgi:hypothetical protein
MLLGEDFYIWEIACAHFWIATFYALYQYEASMLFVVRRKKSFKKILAREFGDHKITL